MVDYNHLSEGNSSGSPSRDIFAELGVASPPQPLVPENSSDNDMGSSSDARMAGFDDVKSVTSSGHSNELEVGADMNQNQISEIFKAAQQLSYNDRMDAAETRKKNVELIAFIEAMGHTVQDVNNFSSKAASKVVVDDYNIRNVHSTGLPEFQERDFPVQGHSQGYPLDKMDGLATVGNYSSDAVGIGGAGITRDPLKSLRSDSISARQLSPTNAEIPDNAGFPEKIDFIGQSKSWSSVVQRGENASTVTLSFHPPILSNGAVMIKPPTEILQQGNSLWSSCLVGSFIHSRLPFKLVEEAAQKLWGQYGLSKVLLHDKDFFLFKFSTVAQCSNVLALGPWYIANKLLKLQLWKEGVDFSKEDCTRAPVWVKFHHIPLSYWTMEGLSYLASGIGRPLFMDKITAKLEPLKYARICIEILATSKLPESIFVTILDDSTNTEQTIEVKVEYQNKPLSCPSCLVFGHSQIKCPKANYQWRPKVVSSSNPAQSCPTIPVPSCPPSVALDIPSSSRPQVPLEVQPNSAWHLVSRRPRVSPPASKTPVETLIKGSKLCLTKNSFSPLTASGNTCNSEDESPVPNPLIRRLLKVDEKDGKDQKSKARVSFDSEQSSLKRSKGGGGISPLI